jgi:hypothetical protein
MMKCLKNLYNKLYKPVGGIRRRVLPVLAHPRHAFQRTLLCATLLLGSVGQVLADVNISAATVSPNTVALGQTASVVINWSMNSDLGPGANVTITSTGGSFTSPATLGSNSRVLTRNFTITASDITITEILQIPTSVIYKAHKQGVSSFLYTRSFDDGVTPDTASVVINIGGGSSGFLNISRLSLKFDTDEIVRVASQDEKLKAIVELNYNGTGLFDAVWEVASPASTSGNPVFAPLWLMRQYLGAGRNAILQSPKLPTNQTGRYLVRLRVNQPGVSFEYPVLQYLVLPETKVGKAAGELSVISLNSPLPFAMYKPATEFRWKTIKGAKAYQLEIHNIDPGLPDNVAVYSSKMDNAIKRPPQTKPVTGIVLPANKTSVKLSAMSQQYLQRGHRYHWRVVAIGTDGSVIAVSGMREIQTP